MASASVLPQRASSSSSTTNSVSYEKYAPRSTAQVSRLSRIAALTAGPTARASVEAANTVEPARKHVLQQALSLATVSVTVVEPKKDNDAQQVNVDSIVTQVLEETAQTTVRLTQQCKYTHSLRLAVRASMNIAEDLSNRHAELIKHSADLSAAADRLQEEEEMLSHHAQEIGLPLEHYDAVDRIGLLVGVLFKGKTVVRGLAKIKVDNEEVYPVTLDEIDKAVEFFGRESGGKQALEAEMQRRRSSKNNGGAGEQLSGNVEYYRRALALQDAALDLIKEAVAERLTHTANQIHATLQLKKTGVSADQLEASLIYTRFHGISNRSNRLLALVRARLHRGDSYRQLLQHCKQVYCTHREALLRMTVRTHMERLQAQHGPVGMTRLASVFLIRLCTLETSLYLDFFGDKKVDASVETDDDKDDHDNDKKKKKKTKTASAVLSDDGTFHDTEFQSYLTSLCSALHRTVRRSLVTMLDLDTLCQIVSVLREERSMASASPTTLAAGRAISSVIEDAQERLIYCANSMLQKEVVRFKATPADLNYPKKLQDAAAAKTLSSSSEAATAATETPTTRSSSTTSSSNNNDDDDVETQLQEAYKSWFPPIRSVLKILSKVFRVVESTVFEDMALQSVQACTRCLKDGAKYIKTKSGVQHSDLFLVKHLLLLREQLSPFDMELRSVERQLDFSDAGKAMARFLANRNRRLFSMSGENALLNLMREGVSVQESSVDSKRDLEEALRTACNDFIDHTAKLLAGDLMQLVDRVKSNDSPKLAQQAWLQADGVLKVLTKTVEEWSDGMATCSSTMGLYLDNPATLSILLKPVQRKVTKSVEDLRKLVMKVEEGELGWEPNVKEQAMELCDQLLEQAAKKSKR